jgi:exopolyphosphatase/pppGpp-phosphohydrolase
MKTKFTLSVITSLILTLFNISNTFSQDKNIFAGIEVGSKGIKMSVIDVDNIKRGDFSVKQFWTENVGIARGIAIDGNLALEDIAAAAAVIKENYNKIKTEHGVIESNIFIVGSSGVAMAKNTDVLIKKIKTEINKDLVFIDATMEGKMLLKGSIPPIDYLNSMVLDIGGGNTKGGYVDVYNNDNFVFFPISFNYGTVTLTETIIKKQKKLASMSEYNELQFGFLPTLREQIKAMYKSKPKALKKENLYISGGAVWAFYTLFNEMEAKGNYNEFHLEDVILYDAMIKNNYKHFEVLAETNKEVARVLKTYSQKYLISASNLLLVCLEDIPEINTKKLFYSKQGQVAWLVSYIADQSKRVKKIW